MGFTNTVNLFCKLKKDVTPAVVVLIISCIAISLLIIAVGIENNTNISVNSEYRNQYNNSIMQGDLSSNNNSKKNYFDDITYQYIDLQSLFNELDANALRAEKTYQDKYVEFSGYIGSFDSDGRYIYIYIYIYIYLSGLLMMSGTLLVFYAILLVIARLIMH